MYRQTVEPGMTPQSPTEQVWDVLDTIIDPELGLPVTDLGLIYRVEVEDGLVTVDMTTTTPVCPLGDYLIAVTRRGVLAIPWVTDVRVNIVHEPAWAPERLSRRARQALGLAG